VGDFVPLARLNWRLDYYIIATGKSQSKLLDISLEFFIKITQNKKGTQSVPLFVIYILMFKF